MFYSVNRENLDSIKSNRMRTIIQILVLAQTMDTMTIS